MNVPDLDCPVSVVVLDFDGTLVDSNELKRRAYYELFPAAATGLINDILARHYEESRYVILEMIRDAVRPEADPAAVVYPLDALARRYDDIVRDGAKHCAEIPGAGELLRALHGRFALYLSSTTPVESLRDIVSHRGWSGYFRSVYGHPAEKTATLREIIARERVAAASVAVFGDGESDLSSAADAGCRFFRAGDAGRIRELRSALEC